MPGHADSALPGWLASAHLDRVWQVLAGRLERGGLQCTGRAQLRDLDRDERHAVGDLIGQPVLTERVVVRLDDLDRRLSERAGAGLVATVSRAVGRALSDRPQERSRREALRRKPFAIAEDWRERYPGLAEDAWFDEWLTGLRRDGVLSRDADAAQTITGALAVVHAVLSGAAGGLSRTDLAAGVLHDAHGLDDGSRVSHLALRALAARSNREQPSDAAGRRTLWDSYGVSADRVSTTCLTLGLRVAGRAPLARRLELAAEAGDPVHLTWWDLERDPVIAVAHRPVIVCENPRVLEAVAERYGASRPAMCLAGRPTLVVLEIVRRLAAQGVVMRYHGDFDWPGIAIANQMAQLSAVPWLMSADDYLRAPGTLALTGVMVEPSWDPALGDAMRERGHVVHEEAVLATVLDGLAE